jgi:hypothetical protein
MRFRLGHRTGGLRSPALVVSILALVVALGGTGYAAFRLPARSVGTAQLKDGAVTAHKVRARTLLARNFAPGQLPRGPAGPPGRPGAPGLAGSARAFGVVRAAGTVVPSRSKGIVALSHPAVGVYCLTLPSSLNPASTTIVATPDEADPVSSSRAVAHVDTNATDCPPATLEVIIRRFSIDTTVSPPVIADHHANDGFAFVVP